MKKLIIGAVLLLIPTLAEAQGTKCVSASPTVDLAAYATGELIGGQLTFTNLLRTNVGSGHITSISIADKEAQAVDLDVAIFRQSLSTSAGGSTTFTDQAAFDPADASIDDIIAVINFGSATRFAFSDNGVKYLGSLAIAVQTPTSVSPSGTLYGAVIARGAYDGASASDLVVTICVAQD